MPSVSMDRNVGAENKKSMLVNPQDMNSQSASAGRGGYMDLEEGVVNPMNPGNRDTYQ